ncbi:MAG: SMC-Scp complex subunit ScpB, partial [Candidatus Micrarchaeia archaeon]
DSAVEIICENGLYHMRLRNEFSDIAARTSQHTDLTKKELKVLAYIAKKEGDTGVMQSQVVKALGATIYDSIHSLEEKRFINSKKKGRSRILNTTAKFREYFRVEGI